MFLIAGGMLVVAVAAQTGQGPGPADDTPPASDRPSVVARAEGDSLPVSIDRIKRRLAQKPPGAGAGDLRLRFYVEVHGRAPQIELFRDFDLVNGPVPFGAPTHAEFLAVVTPREFQTPAADLTTSLSTLFRWLTGTRAR